MTQNIGTDEAIKRWDRFADSYAANHTEQGDIHKEVFLNPTLFSLMGAVKDKKILDAGCGEGYFSRILAKSGATVTAVDYSSRMIEIAKSRTSNDSQIDYKLGNCEDLNFLEDTSFDLIVSNMVIQDLANYEKAFREMYRLLNDGSYFIFSILHPCFVTPESGWEKTEDGEKLHWNVDKYFYEGPYEQRLWSKEKILFFHRTLTSYINTIIKTGFTLESLIEPKPSEEVLKKYPSFEEDFRCADFIVFKLKK
jgi:ubiquinone/menaquinone biosynthesis C-methylase UbiE